MSATLVALCANEDDETGARCPGRLRFVWGMSQAACEVCGAWCGVAVASWAEVESELPLELELYGVSGTTDAIADEIPSEPGGSWEAKWLVNRAGQLLREAADMIRAARQ